MISRIAECCFWLQRHMERLENNSRILAENQSFIMDMGLDPKERWTPVLDVVGEIERFQDLYGQKGYENGETVQDYLVWNENCPLSIISTLRSARENARTIQDILSQETWEAINGLWIWLRKGEGKDSYYQRRYEFYCYIIEKCLLFHGTCQNTIRHDQPFDFMRLGMYLERINQTARTLDLNENMQWLITLQCCGAKESFFKSGHYTLSSKAIVDFLLYDPHFPRSIQFCLVRALEVVEKIRGNPNINVGRKSSDLLQEMVVTHTNQNQETIHENLTLIINKIEELCELINQEFFNRKNESLTRTIL